MPNSLADPMVFFTNGIPILPADLDFQGATSKDQINRLAAFSQLVNDIPAANSKIWLPDGTKTWDVYELVLSMAEFPDSSSATLAEDSNSIVQPPRTELALDWKQAAANVATRLRSAGFQMESISVVPPTANKESAVYARPLAAEAAPGIASQFQTLRAKLETSKLTDLLLGTQFCPTVFYPQSFYQSAYDSYWQPFELTPESGDVWMPVPAGGKITGEMIPVQLQRSWWSTWVFANRAWRFSPDSGMQPISDGGSPPSGSMPVFPSAVLIARNVKTVLPQDASSNGEPRNSIEKSFAPFTLISQAGPVQGNEATSSAEKAPTAAPVNPPHLKVLAEPLADAVAPPMTIFAFVCTPIAVCPNPDPGLNWGS